MENRIVDLAVAANVLNVVDILTTFYFLSLGIKEANPLNIFAMQRLGKLWFLPKLLGFLALTYVFLFLYPAWTFFLICSILLALVVMWNAFQIIKKKKGV